GASPRARRRTVGPLEEAERARRLLVRVLDPRRFSSVISAGGDLVVGAVANEVTLVGDVRRALACDVLDHTFGRDDAHQAALSSRVANTSAHSGFRSMSRRTMRD